MRNTAERVDREEKNADSYYRRTCLLERKFESAKRWRRAGRRTAPRMGDGSRRVTALDRPVEAGQVSQQSHSLSKRNQDREEPIFHASQVDS